MKHIDLVVIGGGSAGMAAAIEAHDKGITDILILEKESGLGGILNQCIHNGFGLTEFHEELTGPEYMQRFIDQVNERGIPYELNAQVLSITKEKTVSYSSSKGFRTVSAGAVVFATGCYERSAGAIQIPGDRPSGILTAGMAQKYLNIHGYMCGRRVVILGSGDIGLIMARRLTLEGAKVLCVSEIMPYSNGLNRNIVQCLNDYDIPLYLSRSVSRVIGKKRLEKVVLSAVDDKMQFIPGTEMEIECDTLVLSVGLVPYTVLLKRMNAPMTPRGNVIVSENMETMVDGIFIAGNCLHVHDLVDFVTEEGREAGRGAADYLLHEEKTRTYRNVLPGDGVSYVVPEVLTRENKGDVTFKFRVRTPVRDKNVVLRSGNTVLAKIRKNALIPSEMVLFRLNGKTLSASEGDLTLSLEDVK